MPPAAHVGNSVDLGNILDLEPDSVSGWYRPAGQVRQHTFIGPRTENTPMLKLAASLEHNIKYENEEIHLDVTVKNVANSNARLPNDQAAKKMVKFIRC